MAGEPTATCPPAVAAATEDSTAAHLRAEHRTRWLELMARAAAAPRPVTVRMHDGVTVEATFRATDADQEAFLVTDLHTPLGVVPSALLRHSDVLSLRFPLRGAAATGGTADEPVSAAEPEASAD